MRIKNFDLGLLLPIIFLSSFGVIVILSTSGSLAKEQLVFAILGLLIFFLVSLTSTLYFESFAPYLYVLALFLLLVTDILGVVSHGSVRWIPLGFAGLTLQASELSKFFLIISLSAFFCTKSLREGIKGLASSLILLGLPAVMVFLQPDLGTALILLSIWLILVLASGIKFEYLLFVTLFVIVLIPLFWQFLKPYQKERINAFLDPNSDPLGSGYHVLQSKIAIGSGGVWGRGFGQGTQSRLRFLPEFHNDFIFASLSEEWGLVGGLTLLSLYVFLLLRILKLSLDSAYGFDRFLSLGVFGLIFSQVVINVGMNLGLAPVTGIPLPLVSSGGSSLVSTMACLGLVQSVALNKRMG